MNSQFNMCESNSQLSRENYLISIIMFLVSCVMYLNITIDKIKNSSVKKDKKDKKKRILELWTEETKDEEKDVNKWYLWTEPAPCRYKGEWANGLPNGKGVKEIFGSADISHSVIEGNFVNGHTDGYGKQTYDITEKHEDFAPYYEGEFKDGKQHGNGTYYFGDGSYRKGNLVNYKFEGNGTYHFRDGSYRKGIMINDKFEGKAMYYDSKRNKTWIGNYVDDVRDLDNGVWYDGEVSLEDVLNNE